MSTSPTVQACVDCGGFAEAPFTLLVDTAGLVTPWVLCTDCYDALLLRLTRQVLRQGLSGADS